MAQPTSQCTSTTVLLICRDRRLGAALRALLSNADNAVTVVATLDAALWQCHMQRPDLLLVHLAACSDEGEPICLALRRHPDLRVVPLLALDDAGGNNVSQAHWLALGADDGCGVNAGLILAKAQALLAMQQRIRSVTSDAATATLLRAMLLHEQATGAHLLRLHKSAGHFGHFLGFAAPEQVQFTRFALLHDIGKLGVRAGLLGKPGRLTSLERAEIYQHTVLGAYLVQALPEGAALAPLVRAHHERWDGQGYPDGLSGTAIPTAARALAVLDVFDALTHDRSYARARHSSEALACLRQGAARQWDAHMVTALHDWLGIGLPTPAHTPGEAAPTDDTLTSAAALLDPQPQAPAYTAARLAQRSAA